MIFDEAHQLPDIASQYFGQSLSSRQLQDLAKILPLPIAPNSKIPSGCRSADRPAQCAQDFRLQLGEPGYRGNLRELLADKISSARCCCSMMPLNSVTTWRNCPSDVQRCWTPPSSAPRFTVGG